MRSEFRSSTSSQGSDLEEPSCIPAQAVARKPTAKLGVLANTGSAMSSPASEPWAHAWRLLHNAPKRSRATANRNHDPTHTMGEAKCLAGYGARRGQLSRSSSEMQPRSNAWDAGRASVHALGEGRPMGEQAEQTQLEDSREQGVPRRHPTWTTMPNTCNKTQLSRARLQLNGGGETHEGGSPLGNSTRRAAQLPFRNDARATSRTAATSSQVRSASPNFLLVNPSRPWPKWGAGSEFGRVRATRPQTRCNLDQHRRSWPGIDRWQRPTWGRLHTRTRAWTLCGPPCGSRAGVVRH